MGTADINLELTYSSTNADEFPQAGTNVESAGKRYACVYNAGAAAIAAGDCCGLFLTTPAQGHVSTTAATMIDNGTAGICAGIGIGAIAAGAYGWLQTGGHCSNITTDEGVSQGDSLVMDGGTTVGKVADTMADGEEECVFASADADDATAVGSGYLLNCALN